MWGGDPLFLARWMRRSGLADLLPALRRGLRGGERREHGGGRHVRGDLHRSRPGDGALESEDVVFDGGVARLLVRGEGAGLVDFGVIPHLEHPDHPDASWANAEAWAARIPAPTYAIDDQTAIRVVDGAADVVSEGRWPAPFRRSTRRRRADTGRRSAALAQETPRRRCDVHLGAVEQLLPGIAALGPTEAHEGREEGSPINTPRSFFRHARRKSRTTRTRRVCRRSRCNVIQIGSRGSSGIRRRRSVGSRLPR